MKLPKTTTIVAIAVVLFVVYILCRPGMNMSGLPWNKGQAGMIFGSGHAGGGQ